MAILLFLVFQYFLTFFHLRNWTFLLILLEYLKIIRLCHKRIWKPNLLWPSCLSFSVFSYTFLCKWYPHCVFQNLNVGFIYQNSEECSYKNRSGWSSFFLYLLTLCCVMETPTADLTVLMKVLLFTKVSGNGWLSSTWTEIKNQYIYGRNILW